MSRHEFEVRFDPKQLRRTTLAYVWRNQARRFKWFDRLAVLALPFGWGWLLYMHPRGWLTWVIPLVVACFVLFLTIAWASYIGSQRHRLSQMKSPVATVVAGDTTLTMSSDLGTTTMPWPAITETLDGPEALYLQFGRMHFITLPTAGVDPAALEFIRERVRTAAR